MLPHLNHACPSSIKTLKITFSLWFESLQAAVSKGRFTWFIWSVFFPSCLGITIIKLQSNDGGNGSGDVASGATSCGGQYLNIYSDWEQPGGVSTGYFLENLSQSCLSLELVGFFSRLASISIHQLFQAMAS